MGTEQTGGAALVGAVGQVEVQQLADLHSTQALVHNMAGQIQMGQTLAKLAEGITIVHLRTIREQKLYKLLDGAEGNMTWAEFCKALGFSKGAVDEKIRTVDRLGADFLELQTAMGLGRDQVRLLMTAPSEVQAEATELAQAAARGDLAPAVLDERFHGLVDRIEKIEAAAAGRTRLIEEREAAEAEAEQAKATAKDEEARRKKAEKAVKLANQRADQLQKELDTPIRLRDPEQAQVYIGQLLYRIEAIAGEIEGAAEIIWHYCEEGHPEGVAPLAREALDVTSTCVARLVDAYSKLITATRDIGEFDEHATLLAMCLDGTDAVEVARRAVALIKAEAEEKSDG